MTPSKFKTSIKNSSSEVGISSGASFAHIFKLTTHLLHFSLVDILVSRNALAEDEAKYLSQFNAHLLGHSNVNQRIFYVDRLRKEMSDLKQVSFWCLHFKEHRMCLATLLILNPHP